MKEKLYLIKLDPKEIDIVEYECHNTTCDCKKPRCAYTKEDLRKAVVQYYESRAVMYRKLDDETFFRLFGFYDVAEQVKGN